VLADDLQRRDRKVVYLDDAVRSRSSTSRSWTGGGSSPMRPGELIDTQKCPLDDGHGRAYN
jgi:hypothetical protein